MPPTATERRSAAPGLLAHQVIRLEAGDRVAVEIPGGPLKFEALVSARSGSGCLLQPVTHQVVRAVGLASPAHCLLVFDRFGARFAHLARLVGIDQAGGAITVALTAGAPRRIEQVRAAFRLPVRLPARYQLREGKRLLRWVRSGRLADISAGGAALEIAAGDPAPAAGRQLRLAFALDNAEPEVRAEATVVRASPTAFGGVVGLQFVGLPPNQEEAIIRWVFAQQRRRAAS